MREKVRICLISQKAKEHSAHLQPCREIQMENSLWVFLAELPDLTLMWKITGDLCLWIFGIWMWKPAAILCVIHIQIYGIKRLRQKDNSPNTMFILSNIPLLYPGVKRFGMAPAAEQRIRQFSPLLQGLHFFLTNSAMSALTLKCIQNVMEYIIKSLRIIHFNRFHEILSAQSWYSKTAWRRKALHCELSWGDFIDKCFALLSWYFK